MIRHTVLCRFRKDADIAGVEAAIKGLQAKIPGILAVTFGANNSPESAAARMAIVVADRREFNQTLAGRTDHGGSSVRSI